MEQNHCSLMELSIETYGLKSRIWWGNNVVYMTKVLLFWNSISSFFPESVNKKTIGCNLIYIYLISTEIPSKHSICQINVTILFQGYT